MKKSFNIIILAGLLLCSFINIFAQEKTISEQDITVLKNKAYKKLEGKTYRVTMTSEGFGKINDPSSKYFIDEVMEYVSNNHHRIFHMKRGQNITREEEISINQKKYIKNNDENWRELLPVANGIGNGTGGGFQTAINEKTVECKYKGKETVKNQQVDLYEITTTRKYDNPNFRSTTVDIEKFWLDKDGMFIRRESKSKLNDGKFFTEIVWEYEYDANIKIEAPIKEGESKVPVKP